MAKQHHDYRLDKDTPDSIRQLEEQGMDSATTSQHGLPAGNLLDNYYEPDEMEDFLEPGEAAREMPAYGKGQAHPRPTEFHSNKGKNR
jgi:hypothetical protein